MRTLILALAVLCGCNLGLSPMQPGDSGGHTGQPFGDTADPGDSGDAPGETGEDCVDMDGDGNTTCDGDCDDNDPTLNLNDTDADGYSSCDDDCDDHDLFTFPGAAEHESSTSCMTDFDEDGYGSDAPANGVSAGTDCSDGNSDLNPGETDVAWDGIDQDCSGSDAGSIESSDNSTAMTINDNSTINSYNTISSCSNIYDIEIEIQIVHTYIGDLTVTLSGPGSETATLHNRSGSSSNNIIGTYAISGGSLTAAQSLTRFLNTNGTGEWKITVQDSASQDTGTLVSWTITLDCP